MATFCWQPGRGRTLTNSGQRRSCGRLSQKAGRTVETLDLFPLLLFPQLCPLVLKDFCSGALSPRPSPRGPVAGEYLVSHVFAHMFEEGVDAEALSAVLGNLPLLKAQFELGRGYNFCKQLASTIKDLEGGGATAFPR